MTETKSKDIIHSEAIAHALLAIEQELAEGTGEHIAVPEAFADALEIAIGALVKVRLRILKETGLPEWADLPV